ncbi:CDP-archaeol synthase [Roseiconus nitratireducens]|uniref:Phosphatidate cytidylyltransferase n=1 Tax=Roseiconus nitratireducens TaxID=2605748 RepID=A0A5M6D234_9BACT|nr:phosphatidate cytidylyltransferase [Roseiconus nitratireducens]KAA5541393.1 CDP-archaeol synthase [Roseiconus nitratireducens]
MLADRLRTSAILITVVVGLILLDAFVVVPGAEGVWLLPLLLFFTIGTAGEIAGMLRAADHPVRPISCVTGPTLVALSSGIPFLWALSPDDYPADCPVGRLGWIVLGSVAAIFVVLIWEMRHYNRIVEYAQEHEDSVSGQRLTPTINQTAGATIRRTCNGVFVSMYVGLPMAMLVATRGLHASTDARFGLAALITIIAVTKSTDAGAYFTGKAIGRHKLIPRLSPGKTVEGSIGGIVTATVVAYGCLAVLIPWLTEPQSNTTPATGLAGVLALPHWGALVLGPVLAVAGMIGDLAESLFKRDAGVKDSGNLLPGLGGVWDVTDSLLAASVPAFFCFAAGVGGA